MRPEGLLVSGVLSAMRVALGGGTPRPRSPEPCATDHVVPCSTPSPVRGSPPGSPPSASAALGLPSWWARPPTSAPPTHPGARDRPDVRVHRAGRHRPDPHRGTVAQRPPAPREARHALGAGAHHRGGDPRRPAHADQGRLGPGPGDGAGHHAHARACRPRRPRRGRRRPLPRTRLLPTRASRPSPRRGPAPSSGSARTARPPTGAAWTAGPSPSAPPRSRSPT